MAIVLNSLILFVSLSNGIDMRSIMVYYTAYKTTLLEKSEINAE